MEIRGEKNDDNTKVVITATFDDESEFDAFNYFMQKMMKEMVEASQGIAIDPINHSIIGDIEGREEEVKEAIKKFAENHVSESNREVIPELRINFVP